MNVYQLPSVSSAGVYNSCKGSLYYIDPSPSINYCTNPSFEYSTDGWVITGTDGLPYGSIIRDTEPYSGYWSAYVTLQGLPGNPNSYAGGILKYENLNVKPQPYYVASFYIKNANARIDRLKVELISGSGASSTTEIFITPEWNRYTISLYQTSPNEYIALQFTTYQDANILVPYTTQFYIDAVQIEGRARATSYFDGDSKGFTISAQTAYSPYGWNGLQHASTSYRTGSAANGGEIVNLQNYGFELIGIAGAGNPEIQNHINTYASTDGGSLQDSIVGVRTISITGRISGSNKTVLHQNVATLMEYFKRDAVPYAQPRAFIFQHTDGIDPVGQPLRFSGAITSAITSDLTNALSVDIAIQIEMIDPYFYGHDESVSFDSATFDTTTITGSVFDWQDVFTASDSIDNPELGGRYYANGTIEVIHVAPDGQVYIGGSFTQITDTKTSTVYAHQYLTIYSPDADAFYAVGERQYPGAPGYFPNGAIYAIASTPDNSAIWIGGAFTNLCGTANWRIGYYEPSTDSVPVSMRGVNNTVRCIYVAPVYDARATYKYYVYIGGEFTQDSTGATNLRRMAKKVAGTTNWLEIGQGVNNTVYSICIDHELDIGIFSGAFTAQTAGTATLFGIGLFSNPLLNLQGTITRYNIAFNGYANSIKRFDTGSAYVVGELGEFVDPVTGVVIGVSGSQNAGSILLCEYPNTTQIDPYDYIREQVYYPPSGTPSVLPIRAIKAELFRDGIVYFAYKTAINDTGGILCYYDGTANVHIPYLPDSLNALDATDTRIYYATRTSTYRYPKPVTITSSSTASAKIRVRLYNNSNYTSAVTPRTYITTIGNFTNNTQLIFANMQGLGPTNIGYGGNALRDQDIWEFDVDSNIVESTLYGSLLDLILPYSKLYTLSVQPGTNVVYVAIYQSDATQTFDVVVGYTQRYQSLFDGVHAQ